MMRPLGRHSSANTSTPAAARKHRPICLRPSAEHTHRRADEAVQYIDDSDGWLSDISSRISGLHLAACEAARSDPIALAHRLVDLVLTSELDGYHRAAATYADMLGEEGPAEFRHTIEPAWNSLCTDDDDDDRQWGQDFTVRNTMIGWAMGIGDPDSLIEVRGRDLRIPDDHLEAAPSVNSSEPWRGSPP